MTKTVAAMTHAIAWIDHHRAEVLPLDAPGASARHLKSHPHPTGQHGSEVRTQHEFFASVAAVLDESTSVLVTGSHTATADFRHYAEKHRPQTAKRIAGYEVVDHPTENQLAALGKRFFEL